MGCQVEYAIKVLLKLYNSGINRTGGAIVFYRNAEDEITHTHKKIARRKKGRHQRIRAKKDLPWFYHKTRNKRTL